ncbi:glycosyltransferase [Geobacter sp. SVR]|uniref:glycosyltransferase n=1 Tax=Geobacter sp. SVR TaxID=2495594 RepID=UPI001EF37277|nr:glycosyltransferase [Geobacter sp. SVR]
MIPNRNHSKFLGTCIESALNQTYPNLEIVVLDNCSDDNSLKVASRYVNRGVRVCKNPINIGNKNFNLLTVLTEGEYMILLCADDVIQPTFIEKSVAIMEQNPNVGYVHCERDYIDGDDVITELDPFYNCNFICPGESVLPIYMLTDVAQPSQCVIRRSIFQKVLGYNTEFDHSNADKALWFRLSLVSDYAYIREKLALIRVHSARETVIAFRSFYHSIALYLTLMNQVELGGQLKGHRNVYEKLPAAFRKLADETLQIALFCIHEDNLKLAKQYLVFAKIMDNSIVESENYILISNIYDSLQCKNDSEKEKIELSMFGKRTRNYEPPENYIKIEIKP